MHAVEDCPSGILLAAPMTSSKSPARPLAYLPHNNTFKPSTKKLGKQTVALKIAAQGLEASGDGLPGSHAKTAHCCSSLIRPSSVFGEQYDSLHSLDPRSRTIWLVSSAAVFEVQIFK